MKRLLLVTYAFPPAPSPGALRPGYLAKYLPRYGWDVTAITNTGEPPPFEADVVRAGPSPDHSLQERIRARIASRTPNPDAFSRRALRAAKELLLFPDTNVPWVPHAVKAGLRAMRQQRYDAILSTAHPPSVHLAGWVLAARSGLPWIADYRDVWTGNLYSNRPKASRFLEGLLERFIIQRASRITTKSATDARLLSAVHGRHADAIENAFDPGDWTEIPQAQPQSFDLCFTGTLYDGKRSPDMLFRALRILCDRNRPAGLQARVHFYGRSCEFVGSMAREFGLEGAVVQHGLVDRRQAMIAQRSSAALLIFLNMDPATNYELGSKYLEYLGAQRPILAFGDTGSDLRRIIVEQKLGWFVSTVDEAIDAISQSYEQYVSGRYAIDPPLESFPTADKLARAFAAVLDETLQHAGTSAARWDAKSEVMPRA